MAQNVLSWVAIDDECGVLQLPEPYSYQNLQRIQDLDIGVSRFQLSVEGAYQISFDRNGMLQPFVEAGMRGDGGDGDTGAGLGMGIFLLFTEVISMNGALEQW